LLNRRHHAAEKGEELARHWFDPFSSAPWFDGWSAPLRARTHLQGVMRSKPTPCAAATTWLLRTGWRRWGPLRVEEVPGAGSKCQDDSGTVSSGRGGGANTAIT
jgi:hypothetical protein